MRGERREDEKGTLGKSGDGGQLVVEVSVELGMAGIKHYIYITLAMFWFPGSGQRPRWRAERNHLRNSFGKRKGELLN